MNLKKQLKIWFTIHFIVDVIFAVLLFIVPGKFLTAFGWVSVDPVSARLVAAALFGIGIESLISRNSTLDSFKTMLSLKVIWSAAAVLGTAISLIEGAQGRPVLAYVILAVFIAFNIIWSRFLIRVRKSLYDTK